MLQLDLGLVTLLYHLSRLVLFIYKIIHRIIMKILSPIVKGLITRKMTSIGVTVNGKEAWDIQIHDDRFYQRLANDRSLGMGETYMESYWDVDDLEGLTYRLLKGGLFTYQRYSWHKFAHWLEFDCFNLQTPTHSLKVAKEHYDLRPELFTAFLDKSMTYTCGYWKNAKNLDEAQIHKMELTARKLKLKPGMRVLDIGCGWGALAHFLATKYQVKVVAVNIAKEGTKVTRERCKGLSVDVRCMDYRGINEKFDRIVSIEMFEHVGHHNFRGYFELVHKCLDDHGLFVLQTGAHDTYGLPRTEPWYDKYIFPNGRLPRPEDLIASAKNLFTLEDWHNFAGDYSLTLRAWNDNFCKNWPSIQHLFPDPPKFKRMFSYYLLTGAACYTARKAGVWSMVWSKNGVPGGYVSER